MIAVFFGPPGAGKGTQAKFIANFLNLLHLSTGDILRDQLKIENTLTIKLRKIMQDGQLVSDEIVNQIVSDRIVKTDCNKGFIFDGYPRTLTQAIYINNFFSNNNLKYDYIFEICLEHEFIIERIKNRAALEKRTDDSVEVIKERIKEYKNQTLPVLQKFKNEYSKIYHKRDGNQEIEKINSLLMSFF